MGYFKRKRTKRRGKKGTKKYRGGMLSSSPNGGLTVNPGSSTSNSTGESTPGTTVEAASNVGAAKAEVITKIEDLKNALNGVNSETTEFGTIKTKMSDIIAAIDALPAT